MQTRQYKRLKKNDMRPSASLKKILHAKPSWALAIFHRLPLSLQKMVYQRLTPSLPRFEPAKIEKLSFFPLDCAWSEVVFAPFHDPEIASGLPCELIAIDGQGCRLTQCWSWLLIEWDAASGPDVAELYLKTALRLPHYDQMIACLTVPQEVSVSLRVSCDGEWLDWQGPFPGTGKRMELLLPVRGKRLDEVRLRISSENEGGHTISLSWFGLRDSSRFETVRSGRVEYDPDWQGLIKPADHWGRPSFELGLLFDENVFQEVARKKQLPFWNRHFTFLEERAKEYMQRVPEKDAGEYLPFDDERYIREYERGRMPFYFEALVLGFVGLINRDPLMMRHALRYLMCMVHTKNWTQSAESRLPGSTWDQRCFLEEMTTYSVSVLADWFAFALTDRAKSLIAQSIWDKGLAVIERDMMKFSYLYHINQGAVFCRARILGGLYLEKIWPRGGKYVRQAFRDMTETLDNYIARDGGGHEGVGYLCQTMQAAIPACIAYARSRGEHPFRYVKRFFGRCESYIEAMSATAPGTAVPEGDCRIDRFCGDGIAVLAKMFPRGVCAKILGACIDSGSLFSVTGTLTNSGGILGMVYGPESVAEPASVAPKFALLKHSGQFACCRKKDGHTYRLHVIGSRANPSHSHFDKSSLVLEADGVALICERGMVNYDHVEANHLKRSCMHNVVTPVIRQGVFADQQIPTVPVVPQGRMRGDSLRVKMDISAVWQRYMSACFRTIYSDVPSEIMVNDEGKLRAPGQLAFHLQSPFPFEIDGNTATVRSGAIRLTVEVPWAKTLSSHQEFMDLHGAPVYHLAAVSYDIQDAFSLNTTIRVSHG